MNKRLIKADNSEAIESVVKGVAKDGRKILKELENFKFKMEQCTNVSANSDLRDKIHQQYDMVDKVMDGLFSVCYDLENFSLVPQYDVDQIDMSNQDNPDSDNNNYDLNEEIPADTTPEEEPAEEETTDENKNEEGSDEGGLDFDLDNEGNKEENGSEEENNSEE